MLVQVVFYDLILLTNMDIFQFSLVAACEPAFKRPVPVLEDTVALWRGSFLWRHLRLLMEIWKER